MTSALIIQEIRNIREDIASIMEQMDRIEALLVDITGLVEIRLVERGNDAVQGPHEHPKEY